MISTVLYAFERGVGYVRYHPQILFALLLVIVLPLAFLYSANQFLQAGQANQNKLQKDRVGILHDSFASLLRASGFNATLMQQEIEALSDLNADITKFRVTIFADGVVIPIAALDSSVIGEAESETELYRNAAIRQDESIIFEFYSADTRYWQAFRAVPDPSSDTMYFIFTETSHHVVDTILQERKHAAYFVLAFTYVCVLLIAYWLIRITDYQYLYRDAKNAIKTKDLFTNMIAHELRAPLTAIKGYANMIVDSDHTAPKEREYAMRVQHSSERLIEIVNDLLDVARLQSGKLSVTVTRIDIAAVICAVTDELQASAQKKNISLTHHNCESESFAMADQKRLHQALTNLVSNAIKYTKEGGIEIDLHEKRKDYEIRVKDTGMGISAEDQEKLFAPFFRVASEDVSAITGTGLGMWITRQLIELMGAEIGVESIKDIGTHIVVTIPKTRQTKQT